ncbi:MAG: xanthine dehydrogenase accessory protein XdhC [Rubrivivax sp.]|nr:xanthine dehydrogenase accessory protein XdhC [Rubrivivax sp.]
MWSALALRETARQWLASGRPAVVVEVVRSRGSVPREAGTRMLVAADTAAGTIGGGHLEWQALADARQLLQQADAAPAVVEQHIALGPTLGQCCGGTVGLRLQHLNAAHLDNWPFPPARFQLQLYGAGHVGRAVVRLLADLPCQVSWIDERDHSTDGSRWLESPDLPAHIERRCVEPVDAEVASAPPGCCFLVMTHSHALDWALTQAILQRTDFRWFGLIGSQTKRARFVHRLRDRGLPESQIDRMVCPVGLPGIFGKEPEVLALAVVAQLMSLPPGAPEPALH